MPNKGDTPDSLHGVPGWYPGVQEGSGGVKMGKIIDFRPFLIIFGTSVQGPRVPRGSPGVPERSLRVP
jgi:hypothetical protein